MNIEHLKKLVDEAEKLDPQNEVLWEINYNKRFFEMSKDLDETIEYLNQCSENELLWATEALEELSEKFKSEKLIKCVEDNIKRCANEEVKKQLEMILEYMRYYI